MTDACIIIPARYASSRYPGKPLAMLTGASGEKRTLLERSVMAARKVGECIGREVPVFVATDDIRVGAEAERIGTDVIMTDASCRNGTERVAQAVDAAGLTAEVIINLQGDAPLTPPGFVAALLEVMCTTPRINVATPILRCDTESVLNFIEDRRHGRVGATTVVTNKQGGALYFSKEVLPFTNGLGTVEGTVPVFHHVGLYAYRRSALVAYRQWEPGVLEELEGLEQLRFLENGYPVTTVEVTAPGARFWELNNPSDVPLIEQYLGQMGWE
ncbi:3-deoxy-manno-octulosonate cytidylyltransferase [Paracoccus sp. (in: a-proteobacteria)]|uniref:3-deoxy-manno-octulosonate cytidylyltransferase n=1 Tax=Paracoccus sp. TaxID=267 RepID=UPI002AFE1B39|nr:3-deoxy-manno-octulosonate cytidylyltransferase [Paracoccus sp. (in: a-proteobacteria)]